MWCEVVNRSSQGCSWQACGKHGSCLRLLGTSISMRQELHHKGCLKLHQPWSMQQLMPCSWVIQIFAGLQCIRSLPACMRALAADATSLQEAGEIMDMSSRDPYWVEEVDEVKDHSVPCDGPSGQAGCKVCCILDMQDLEVLVASHPPAGLCCNRSSDPGALNPKP